MAVCVAVTGLSVYTILDIVDDEGAGVSNVQWHRACDVLVREFVTTTDAVVVRRDQVLINHLHCDVTRRAVPILAPKT
jgi:hypothetical protein